MCLLIECGAPGSSNEEAAKQEEVEAMALQKRMAAALHEEDFEVSQIHDIKIATISKSDKNENDINLVCLSFYLCVFYSLFYQEIVTRDLTKLSKDDKLEVYSTIHYYIITV